MAPVSKPVYTESKAAPSFAGLSPEELAALFMRQHGLYEYLLHHERHHIVSGKSPNLAGWVLYLFELNGRDTTVPVLMAEGELSERSAIAGLTKLNELLWAVFKLKIILDKSSQQIRLSDVDAAKDATDEFLDKFNKAQREFGRTMTAFSQVDPERAARLIDQSIQQRLAAGAMTQRQVDEINGFRRSLAPSAN